MRYEDERYVRLYTRDTTTWKLLPWQARFVLMSLLRKVDRAGLLDLDGDPIESIAAVAEIPEGIVREGWPQLLKRKVFALTADGQALVMPNFLSAQESTQSDKARKRAQRERARSHALRPDGSDGNGGEHPGTDDASGTEDGDQSPAASRIVTDGHETGQKVTPGHAVSRAVTPCRAVPNQEIVASAREAEGDSWWSADPKTVATESVHAVRALALGLEAFAKHHGRKRRAESPPPFAYQDALTALAPPGSHFLVPVEGELDAGVIIGVRKRVRQFPDLATWQTVGAFIASGGVEFPRELNASWVASSRFCDAVTAARSWREKRPPAPAAPADDGYRAPTIPARLTALTGGATPPKHEPALDDLFLKLGAR